jgi:hypothetical protein
MITAKPWGKRKNTAIFKRPGRYTGDRGGCYDGGLSKMPCKPQVFPRKDL